MADVKSPLDREEFDAMMRDAASAAINQAREVAGGVIPMRTEQVVLNDFDVRLHERPFVPHAISAARETIGGLRVGTPAVSALRASTGIDAYAKWTSSKAGLAPAASVRNSTISSSSECPRTEPPLGS